MSTGGVASQGCGCCLYAWHCRLDRARAQEANWALPAAANRHCGCRGFIWLWCAHVHLCLFAKQALCFWGSTLHLHTWPAKGPQHCVYEIFF